MLLDDDFVLRVGRCCRGTVDMEIGSRTSAVGIEEGGLSSEAGQPEIPERLALAARPRSNRRAKNPPNNSGPDDNRPSTAHFQHPATR